MRASTTAVKRSVARVADAARHPRRTLEQERIRRRFVVDFLGNRRLLRSYDREVRESGLVWHLRERAYELQRLAEDASGPRHTLGAIGYREGMHLYAVLRTLRPRIAVETGVANGFSTAFSLLALERNGEGELYSIDLPREVGREYEPGTFYEGTGRAGIPPGSQPGWLIPDELRPRWTLVLGRTQDELPPLLKRLGAIDSFLHDSEHSFECMWFEYTQAWPALRDGGVLISHDVKSTNAFPRFAREQEREPVPLSRGMALLVK